MIKVVPSAHRALNGTETPSNVFSVTEHVRPLHWFSGAQAMPSVVFSYSISAMKVQFTEQRGAPEKRPNPATAPPPEQLPISSEPLCSLGGVAMERLCGAGASLMRAVARICALVGGVYAVGGIVQALVYHSAAAVKQNIGKQS